MVYVSPGSAHYQVDLTLKPEFERPACVPGIWRCGGIQVLLGLGIALRNYLDGPITALLCLSSAAVC